MKKRCLTLLIGTLLSLNLMIAPVFASTTGWIKHDRSWYYLNADGSKAKGWLKDNGNWYYLSPAYGEMQTGWVRLEDNYYYMYPSGEMAYNTTIDGHYLNSEGAWTTNTFNGKWECPQIKSTAPSDVSAGFKILHDELGFGYSEGWAGYSTYVDNPTYLTPTALAVTKNITREHNAEIRIVIRQWANDTNVTNSYRVKPIAKQLFKFYFPNGYETLFNDVETLYNGTDAEGYALLNHVVTIDGRQVYFTSPDKQNLAIWITSPGENISL